MTRKDILKIQESLGTEELRLANIRNREYATDENPFSNFEEEAEFIEIGTERVFLLYLKENVGRLKTILKSGKVDPKQVKDKVMDLRVYAALLYAWLCKEERLSKKA